MDKPAGSRRLYTTAAPSTCACATTHAFLVLGLVLLQHNAHCASACAAQSSVAFWEQQASPRMGFSEKLGQAKNGRLLLLLSKPSHCLHLPINGFSSQTVGVQMLNLVI